MISFNLLVHETVSEQRARAGRLGGSKPKHGRTAAERFCVKVDQSGACWRWCGARGSDGYGRFFMAGHQWQATQAAWTLARGPIPAGMLVCHRCDNPECVNPDHLFLGTALDNAQDRDTKNRAGDFRGAANGNARLTSETIAAIRASCAAGEGRASVAARFGISRKHVYQIATGRRWASMCEPPTRDDDE